MTEPNTSAKMGRAELEIPHAINNASREMLQSVLREILRTVPPARQIVAELLLCYEEDVPQPNSDSDSDDDEEESEEDSDTDTDRPESEDDSNEIKRTKVKYNDPVETSNVSKRVRPRFAMCENCETEFDVTANTKKSCHYHTDFAQPDEYQFPDHDELCHGPMDTPENREMFPDRFIYECCDRTMEEEPCTTGRHSEVMYSFTKRQRIW